MLSPLGIGTEPCESRASQSDSRASQSGKMPPLPSSFPTQLSLSKARPFKAGGTSKPNPTAVTPQSSRWSRRRVVLRFRARATAPQAGSPRLPLDTLNSQFIEGNKDQMRTQSPNKEILDRQSPYMCIQKEHSGVKMTRNWG
jgi:hypothetical protein